MYKRKNKRSVLLAVFMALIVFFSQLVFTGAVYGAETEYPFDQTNVLDDLESSEEFNLINYPWDFYGLHKKPAIMNFVEWCYSPFETGDFALYIYFYNPQNLKIDEDSFSNKIQMACAYDVYPITPESIPTDYDTYNLLFCNKSERPNYEGLFYKFRVVDKKGADGKYIADRVYSGERRYDVSGVVLAQEDGTTKEYMVGGTFFFTGYASGYGPNANSESTLECTGFRAMETIELEVHKTNYRTESSSLGQYHENEVTSVYFSVPDYYFDKYGNLQKIKAEWYEYETKEILIVNSSVYRTLEPWIGVNIGIHNDDLSLRYYKNFRETHSPYGEIDWAYNMAEEDIFTIKYSCDTLYWLFPADDRVVTSAQMEDYVTNYNKTFNKGKLQLKNGKVSADLFKDGLSEARAKVPYVDDNIHHKLAEFDANDDTFNLLSYDATHSGWDRFWDYFFNWSNAPKDPSLYNVSPIEYKDLGTYIKMSDSNASDLLLVNKDDIPNLRTFYNNAEANDETTVLFRFAQTDYYQEGLYGSSGGKGAYADIAQTSVFLDFKIIQLTFLNEDEVYKVIPVSHDPIDVYNGLSPTEKPNAVLSWFEQFLRTLGAWGTFIVAIAVGILVIILIVNMLKWAHSANLFFKIVLIILAIGIGVVVGVFVVPWVIDLITSLGGLF